MRARLLPATAVSLALAWLVAQALDAGWLAAAVCVAAIPAACLTVIARRRRAGLMLGLAFLTLALGAFLFTLLTLPPGCTALPLELAFVALLAPLVPVLYAATFPRDEEPPP